jgi:SAM-dependent methyltransferase
MRVLDLGCGRAVTSIFLAREFHASVWAVDSRVSPTENFLRAREAGCADRVFPLRADARRLPFAEEYFDAVVAVDSYYYFGTDERYLSRLCRHLAPGGYVGVVDVGLSREIGGREEIPEFLRRTFARHWSFVHSPQWWRLRWERSGCVDVLGAEALPESREILRAHLRDSVFAGNEDEICRAVREDAEDLIVLFRLVARKLPPR